LESSSAANDSGNGPRRSFLAAAGSLLIGGLISITPVTAGLLFFLDPILRRRPNFKGGDADGYLSVTNLPDLPDDGTPVRCVIRADKVDAWNISKNQSVGTVYIRKMPGDQIIAFNDTCPHLGCKVDYHEEKQTFLCPCHASAFHLDGEPANKVPPRRLDHLETKLDTQGRVWVKYQEFQCGIAEQKAV
jgi:menaquinol-cytochrome c reductase iron-sulfur subunit